METSRILNRGINFYVVQKGDTLSQIGERVGLPWRWLARLNQLSDPNFIQAGQLIQLEE